MNLVELIYTLAKYDDTETPIKYDIHLHGLTRKITVGKQLNKEGMFWEFTYEETYRTPVYYPTTNNNDINTFVVELCASIKGNVIDIIERV